MAVARPVQLDRVRIRELAEREERRLIDATPRSAELYRRALRSMTRGVPSSYQVRDPYPIYLREGRGSRVHDVDGREYVDVHNGFGARAVTGRDTIVKIFGSYHGHHDYVMVSAVAQDDDIGPPDNLRSIPYGQGIPQVVVDLTVPVPFNDAAAMERRIERLVAGGRAPACVIMEAAMMNLGVILPEPGYLEAVREITRRHGIVLIFDEVKTGMCVAPGGATERFGVAPDMVTLAKALAGGLPSGAIGGTGEVMEVVADGRVFQVGTYNGNPLSMAAARASLLEVLTPEAYTHLDRLNDRMLAGCQEILDRYRLAGDTVGISSKGCVRFTDAPITDYASFMAHQDGELTELAWLYNINRGVLMAPGREEEWTLSVQHTEADVDRYLAALEELAADVTA